MSLYPIFKIAFLSYTYGTNGIAIPKGKEYCINLIDKELIQKQLESAKAQNPDVICVSMHWGIEYKLQPNTEQIDMLHYLYVHELLCMPVPLPATERSSKKDL